jgi:hypothetical protein
MPRLMSRLSELPRLTMKAGTYTLLIWSSLSYRSLMAVLLPLSLIRLI